MSVVDVSWGLCMKVLLMDSGHSCDVVCLDQVSCWFLSGMNVALCLQ